MTSLAHDRRTASETADGIATTIYLVPHTHWDREWYEPFQTFRMRLVELVDQVLDLLESQPSFRFTLDGQLATVDDYLEVRPAAEDRIRRFVSEGRLAIGPWQILMDEFLVSGETIVRNLQRGWSRAHELGGVMAVGYLPDMFGHIAQMPQILRRAGLEQAVVWRGVPAAVTGNRFRWRSPDGSEVPTEYLVGGYGNGAHLFDVPSEAIPQARAYGLHMAPVYGADSVLAMYGTDHMVPTSDTVELVGEVNRSANDISLRMATLAEYIEHVAGSDRRDEMVLEGELRSGARANMLMGVASAHLDIRAAAAHAERWLTRYAEPLSALYAQAWPSRLLELAWHRVIENSAHDSICGCSVDAVTAQVVVRYAEAEQIARGVAERALAPIAERLPRGWLAAVNPSPHTRDGLVAVDVPVGAQSGDVVLETGDGRRIATQEISRNEPLIFDERMSGADAARFVRRRPHRRELFGLNVNAARLEHGPRRVLIELDDEAEPEWLDLHSLWEPIIAGLEAEADEEWLVRVVAAPRRRLWAIVEAPGLGSTAFLPLEGSRADDHDGGPVVDHPVAVTENALDNGLLRVELAADGTFSLICDGRSVEGVGRLVDGGDAGDSYNYAPPADDRLIDTPGAVSTDVVAAGPLVGELVVTRRYDWPRALAGDRRSRDAETVATDVAMHLELRAGEPFVRVSVELDNRADDHRLRFHVPLPEPASRSFAEGQFAVVERGLSMEGGHGEVPLPTYPAYGFVSAGSIAALLDHVTEYELVEGGRELALTCLRSIGWISRNDNPYREDPAGPERPVPAAQMRGRQSIRFALLPHAGDWRAANVARLADEYAHDFLVVAGSSPKATAEATPPGLTIDGDGVVMTALLRRGEWLELRLVNVNGHATQARVAGAITHAREADLLGGPGAQLDVREASVRLDLGPAQIRTIQVRRSA